jgi:hypothetical protein
MSQPTHAERLIDASLAVYKHARMAAAYCADQRGELAEPHRLRSLYDTAETHLLLADALGRASTLSQDIARLAARAAQASLDAYSSADADVLRTLYAVTAEAKREAQIFTGDQEEAEVEDPAREEALKETFPASDTVPPPTTV